ncbi:MAG: hypothetical protein IJM79_07230 [Erysipelotrichaceae bacterium]|nr:hypothetical protein [Erysipelotrichaceae bacterium]
MKIRESLVKAYLRLPRNPRKGEGVINIACIGDSVTRGAGVMGRRDQTWEYYLNEKLGDDYRVINCGISGCTLQKQADCPYVESSLYPSTLKLKADIYLVMLGSNDTKTANWNEERYERELKDFLKGYLTLDNSPRIIVMIPPECFPYNEAGDVAYSIDKHLVDNVLPGIIRKTAGKLDIELIDLLEPTRGHEEWYVDGVHPNAEGNRQIAEVIAAHLR